MTARASLAISELLLLWYELRAERVFIGALDLLRLLLFSLLEELGEVFALAFEWYFLTDIIPHYLYYLLD